MSPICFVGEVVRWFHQRPRSGYDNFEGVILDFLPESTGLEEMLVVYDPNCAEPELVSSREIEKVKFADASLELQAASKTLLAQAKSKGYLSR